MLLTLEETQETGWLTSKIDDRFYDLAESIRLMANFVECTISYALPSLKRHIRC